MRTLFRGVSRRYDVKRRVRHCLCVITKYPFFKFFKNILMELHAVAMLEEKPGCCRQFIDCIYRLADINSAPEQLLTVPSGTISAMYADYALMRPRIVAGVGMSSKEVPILPLFDSLGTERFFKLLSAVLCEQRIVFIAEEAETLSATVLAAANMLHPFKWHHVFIPLLPGKLLNYLMSQAPYMIGVRKYLLSELRRDSLDGTVVVDCDSGEVRLQGQVHVRDLIGDSATARKQASESIDQMKAKMSKFMGMGSSESPQDIGPRDLMVVLLSDLKSAITSTKPSSYTISTLLSGGMNRSVEEAKMQWALDAEKSLRDNLTTFFAYFFADLDEYMTSSAASGGATRGFGTLTKSADPALSRRMSAMSTESFAVGELRFPPDDHRSHFDLKSFLTKRSQMGDSRHLLYFLSEFIQSQLFERFCGELIQKKQAQLTEHKHKSMAAAVSSSLSSSGSRAAVQSLPVSLSGQGSVGAGDEDDLFERVCKEWSVRAQPLTIANIKLAIASCAPTTVAGKEMSSNFHHNTVQYTSSASPLAPCEVDVDRDGHYYTSYIGNTNQCSGDSSGARDSSKRLAAVDGMLRRIVADAGDGDQFLCIMRTIQFRLQGCLAAGSRGSAGISGVRALLLCRSLLLEGPECVLTYSVDFIPTLRALLRISKSLDHTGSSQGKKTSKQQQALDYMSLGAFVDPTHCARTLLDLVLDHKKLTVQRKVCLLLKNGSFPFLTAFTSGPELQPAPYVRTEMLFSASYSSAKLFPRFDMLHQSLNAMGFPSVPPAVLQLTTPELAVGAVEDRQNNGGADDDDDLAYQRGNQTAINISPSSRGTAASSSAATPSALASYGSSNSLKNGQPPAGPPKTRERFIYGDNDDNDDSTPALSSSRPFSASGVPRPDKPKRPDSGRSMSPFKQNMETTGTSNGSGQASLPKSSTAEGGIAVGRRGSMRTVPIAAPKQQPSWAGDGDLLDLDLPSPAPSVVSSNFGPDPFGVDPFDPSFAPTAASVGDGFAPSVSVDPFADFAPSAPSGPATPAAASAFDDFAPSTSWDGFSSSSSAAPIRTASPFDTFAPTTSATATVSSDPFASFAPSSDVSSSFGASLNAKSGAADEFVPSMSRPSNSSSPAAMSAGGMGFIHSKPPPGSKPAVDPFDFLNPIKK